MLNELNIFFNIFKSQIEKKNEKGSELAAMVPMYANILLQYNTWHSQYLWKMHICLLFEHS